MAERRKFYERPLLDWVLAAAVAVILALSPLRTLVTAADEAAQRGAMISVASILGVLASFTAAATFFYASAGNPTARAVRARWGRWYTWAFLRALAVLLVGSFICVFASLGVASSGATIVFFAAVCTSLAKLVRILLIVAALLLSQQTDAHELPPLDRRPQRSTS